MNRKINDSKDKIVSIERFHQRVPGRRIFFDMSEHWNSLKLDEFEFSALIEGRTVASQGHSFSVMHYGAHYLREF